MTSQHHVSELVAINGTKSRPKLRPKSQPESGPSWDHVGTKSGPSRAQVIFQPPTQLSTQSPTQLHTISSSQYVIKQVTENVFATNHREHRGHRDLAVEVGSTAKVTARVTAKVTAHPGACKND